MAINTLVTIKDSITAFAVGHGQLQGRVIFEADDHRSAYITEENTYPLLFVAPIDVAVNRAMNVHTLRVYVYERINDDRLDVWENANDTSLILRDIRVWWNDYGVDDINIVEDPIGQFGCDKELDNLVGYYADIRFEIPSHGRCQVPVDVEPLPPPPSCEDATQIIEDTLGNQLYLNSIPSGDTETQVIQNSTAILKDTSGTFISSTSIIAEGSEAITAPNAKLHIKKENDGTIINLNLLSNSSTDYIIDNNDISVNGVFEFDIHATEPLDIRLRDTSNAVITPNSVTESGNHVTIVLPLAPDTTIEVNGVAEGSVVAGSTVDIQLSDSSGVVVPTSVTQVGNDFQVVLPDAPFTGWVRPIDWLAVPSISIGEQVFYGLIAVQNVTLGNFVAFSFAGNYTVDWGDGSSLENVSSGVTAQHQYNWANVGNVTSEGFRQALIKVTPQVGQNLTNINLQKAHSTIGNGKTSQFIDMVMSLPNVTGVNQTIGNGTFVYHRRCQRVWIKEMGAITLGTQMFFSFTSLQSVPLFDTSSMTLMNAMFSSCTSLIEIPLFITSIVTDMSLMFNGCQSLKTVPLLDTGLVTQMAQMFNSCNSLQHLPLLNTVNVTSMSTMFLSCTALESIPAFNTAALINTVNMFNACPSFKIATLNMALVTSTTTMFGGTTLNLQQFLATGLTRGISVANQQMSAAELNNFFTSLGTASGAQTITVTGNHGAATCNTAIATGKGFTVVI